MRKIAFVRILLSLAFISVALSSAAQKKGSKVLMAPKAYRTPVGSLESQGYQPLSPSSNNVWIVFSDRDNNQCYGLPDASSSPVRTAAYMEPFYVMEQKGEFLHLAKYELDSKLFEKDYKLSKDLEDCGWINAKNLLCWNVCLVNATTKFSIKALSISPLKKLENIGDYVKDKNLRLYNDPDFKTENNEQMRLFDFLYIYKKSDDKKAFLVGTTDNINRFVAKNASKKILGWVKSELVKEWADRVVIEPNWDETAVSERKEKGVKAVVFSNPIVAAKYKATGQSDPNYVLSDPDPLGYGADSRKPPNWKRMPFFKTKTDTTVLKTGVVTDVFDKNAKVVIQSDTQVMVEKEYNLMRKNYRQVNIMFVIDGSEIMQDYRNSIISTLSGCVNKLDAMEKETSSSNEENSGNHYKMGLVVYRDYSDKACKTGLKDIQIKHLTNTYEDVVQFMSQEVEFKNCMEKDPHRSVYYGIQTAMREFEDPHQTNIIFLIGSAGNNPSDQTVRAEEVVSSLVANKVGVFAFQVKHPLGDAYEDFSIQLSDIIEKESKKIIGDINASGLTAGKTLKNPQFFEKGHNLNKLNCPSNSPIPGAIMFADLANPIAPDQLETEIFKLLTEKQAETEDIIEAMDSKIKGQGHQEDMTPGMILFLSQMNVNIDLLRKTSFNNLQLFIDGYTTMTCDKLTHPLYKRSIFLSSGELTDLINDLKKIGDRDASEKEAREKMQTAFQHLLSARIGDKEAKSKMGSLTGGQLMELITGLNISANNILSKYKLDEITTKKVSKDDFELMQEQIMQKLEGLQKYQSDKDHTFTSNDMEYYWVPEDLFP